MFILILKQDCVTFEKMNKSFFLLQVKSGIIIRKTLNHFSALGGCIKPHLLYSSSLVVFLITFDHSGCMKKCENDALSSHWRFISLSMSTSLTWLQACLSERRRAQWYTFQRKPAQCDMSSYFYSPPADQEWIVLILCQIYREEEGNNSSSHPWRGINISEKKNKNMVWW